MMVQQTAYTTDDVWKSYGTETAVSDWVRVEQSLTDKFAEATMDPDWMHLDPERCKRDGPYDTTIAFGFWTMSMLTHFIRQTTGREYPEGALYGFNYGFDRVRLTAPVKMGTRIRAHQKLVDVQDRGNGRFVIKNEVRIEIEGEEKPAMYAEWLGMMIYPSPDAAGE